MLGVGTLLPYAGNARQHSKAQIKKLAASIKAFGFISPLIVDQNNVVVCGHGRLAGAQHLGMTHVPCVRVEHLSEVQLQAYRIADNRLAEDATWNMGVLALEFQLMRASGIEPLETGFELPEIALILDGDQASKVRDADDDVPGLTTTAAITRLDDVWVMGRHRLVCGDARDTNAYAALMRTEKARLIISDPPYNVPIGGNVSGKGRVKHREFAHASGELNSPQFGRFMDTSLGCFSDYAVDGSIHFIFTDWRHLPEMLTAGSRVYRELKNLVVWAKTNAGMGTFYRSQHELVLVWKKGRAKHVNNFELGQHGRSRTNVWQYAGANAFGRDRMDELAMHPTVKPVAMIADAILDCSYGDDIVLDGFGGSGSTLIACERTGRQGRLIELDPLYCDQTVRRWQLATKQQAIREACGTSFDQLERTSKSEGARHG